MKQPPALTTFRIGDPGASGSGLRIGTVRRPPRGVPRARWQSEGLFDVWFPSIAPSRELLARFPPGTLDDPARFGRFAAAYRRELEQSEARQTVELLAALSTRTPIAIGCYCDDISRCHLSVLQRAIEDARASV